MKKVLTLFSIASLLLLVSCGGPKADSSWDFLGMNDVQFKSFMSNTPEELSAMIEGSWEDNQVKFKELLSKAGYAPATKIHELEEFSGPMSDDLLKIKAQQLIFIPLLKIQSNYVKGTEGIKLTVVKQGEEVKLRLKKYSITNTIELHNKAIAIAKTMLPGQYVLSLRDFTNLEEFSGEDLTTIQSILPAFKLLANTLKLQINEDGTYEESFPFMNGTVVVIKGNWEMDEDFDQIVFTPTDKSGNNLLDSYFLANEVQTEMNTTASITSLSNKMLILAAKKYKGVIIKSIFEKK